jgi:hypothetical protein
VTRTLQKDRNHLLAKAGTVLLAGRNIGLCQNAGQTGKDGFDFGGSSAVQSRRRHLRGEMWLG